MVTKKRKPNSVIRVEPRIRKPKQKERLVNTLMDPKIRDKWLTNWELAKMSQNKQRRVQQWLRWLTLANLVDIRVIQRRTGAFINRYRLHPDTSAYQCMKVLL